MAEDVSGENAPVMLITGASRGIGRHLAEYYVAEGWRVVGTSRSDSDFSHPFYLHVRADVSSEDSVRSLIARIRREYRRLDCLLNNAGVAAMNHLLLTPEATARAIFDTNFFGTFIVTREAARLMRTSAAGRIVNFTSIAVPLDLGGEAIYAASKSAIESFTRIAARELANLNITVNAIGPTPIPTDMIKGVPPDSINRLIAIQAIKRYGDFTDVANVVDFFIRRESSFITGQTIYLGGIS